MKQVKYPPFEISYREDDEGQWRFSATVAGKSLFHDLPYHELTMSMILIDHLVAQELGMDEQDE